MDTHTQTFRFAAPDTANFLKKSRLTGYLFIVFLGLYIASLSVTPDETFTYKALSSWRFIPLGVLFHGWVKFWIDHRNRYHQSRFGRIEISDATVKIITGHEQPIVVSFEDIEKVENSGRVLKIFQRVKGRLKHKSILLSDLEHSLDFVAAVQQRLVTGL